MKKTGGFTLIELMVVVIVVSILAGIAITSYGKQVRKSRRAEAKQVLVDLSLREEKYRSSNALYGACDAVLAPSSCTALNSVSKYYSYSLTAGPTATVYQFTAARKGDQTKDTCSDLTIGMNAGVVTKLPTGCW